MTAKMNNVIGEIETLTATEKSFVVQYIISSLDKKDDKDATEKWASLAKNRYEELHSGKVESVSWESIKQQVLGS